MTREELQQLLFDVQRAKVSASEAARRIQHAAAPADGQWWVYQVSLVEDRHRFRFLIVQGDGSREQVEGHLQEGEFVDYVASLGGVILPGPVEIVWPGICRRAETIARDEVARAHARASGR